MNDKIYTLATRAWMTEQGSNRDPIVPREFIEKFAELIVRECAKQAYREELTVEEGMMRCRRILEHFGVEE